VLLLEFWVKHGSNAGHLIKHFLLSRQLKLWKSVHNQMYYPKLWLALLVTNVHNMVSDPPTPTKNDMILFSGVLEVACHGWRSRLCDDTDCKLCNNDQETPVQLCKDCPFTKEVWGILKQRFNLSVLDLLVSTAGSIYNYWCRCKWKFDKTQRRDVDEILIYFWWNIWKERNRMIFQQKHLNLRQVAFICKDEIMQYRLAINGTDASRVSSYLKV